MARKKSYYHHNDTTLEAIQQRFSNASYLFLLYEGSVDSANRKHRIYLDPDYAIIHTFNAQWMGSQWQADSTSYSAYRNDFGYRVFGQSVQASTATPWANDDWNPSDSTPSAVLRAARFIYDSGAGMTAYALQLVGQATTNSGIPEKNALYADNIPKAWAKVVISGGGGGGNWSVLSRTGFNVASVTRAAAQTIRVTLHTAVDSVSSMCPTGIARDGTTTYPLVPSFDPNAADEVDIRLYDVGLSTWVDLDDLSSNVDLSFTLFAKQSS